MKSNFDLLSFEEQQRAMDIIINIQLMERFLKKENAHTFEELSDMPILALEDLRGNLIPKWNEYAKKESIRKLFLPMLEKSFQAIEEKLFDKAFNQGAIDLSDWSEENNMMLLPKAILIACLESEADQYRATGTSFEKKIKKLVKSLRSFI